jgi:hypothetical protein
VTTVLAGLVASAVLVAFVLPADYAIDPLGLGRRLGLTDIAAPPAARPVDAVPEGAPLAPVQKGPIGEYPGEFRVDVFDFVLQPYEYLEYKYALEKGATMLYAWTADAEVEHDFHGERAAEAADGPAEESFDTSTRRQAAAAYTAPFSGIHGWYWENPGAEPIAVSLRSAGFYTSAVEIHSNRRRVPHVVRPLEGAAPPPAVPESASQP